MTFSDVGTEASNAADKENYGDHTTTDVASQDAQAKTKKIRRPGARRKERREACRKALTDWRLSTWMTTNGPSTPLTALLPDTAITKLATRARINTLADIKEEIPEWDRADEYGEEVLRLLQPLDASWNEENERRKSERKEERARVNKENRIKRYEEYLLHKRQETAHRKALEAYRRALMTVRTPGQYLPYTVGSDRVVSHPVPENSLGRVVVQQPYYVYSVPYPANAGLVSGQAQSYMYANAPYPAYQWPTQNAS